jgi:hypothetical protein
VTLAVMSNAFDAPQTHRQQRLGALERWHLAFLIYAQHQRMIRRIPVQTDDIALHV